MTTPQPTSCPFCGVLEATVICRFCSRAKFDFTDKDGRLGLHPVYPCATQRDHAEPDQDDALEVGRDTLAAIVLAAVAGFAVALVLALLPSAALAADFSVSPMTLKLAPGARSGDVQIRNHGAEPVRFQIRAADLTIAEDGKEALAPTRTLVFFPRTFELAPGEARTIRLGVRALAAQRRTYLVSISEVFAEAEAAPTAGAQIRLLLNVQVPVTIPGWQ